MSFVCGRQKGSDEQSNEGPAHVCGAWHCRLHRRGRGLLGVLEPDGQPRQQRHLGHGRAVRQRCRLGALQPHQRQTGGQPVLLHQGDLLGVARCLGQGLHAEHGGALASSVNLKIEPGTQATSTFPSCTGFTPDAGAALYEGTLASFASEHGSFANGIADNPGTVATKWSTGDSVVYRVTATLAANAPDSAQGQSTGHATSSAGRRRTSRRCDVCARSPRSSARSSTASFWAVVVAAAALILAVALPLAFGDRPHTVLTGSMEPTISPGDVVIDARISPLDARVGDVVTFRDPEDQSKLITHRVKRIRRSGSHLWFVTQGDANNTTEHWRIAANGELGRVVYTIPWIGHVAVSHPAHRGGCCCSWSFHFFCSPSTSW